MTEDNWKTPIDMARAMVEKWDASGQLPKTQLDAEGSELFSSRMRKHIAAHALEKQLDPKPPRTGPARAKTLEVETPAMRAYLIECRQRAAQLSGQAYVGPQEHHPVIAAIWAKDAAQWNREHEELFHNETPRALGDMGLEKLEIELLPELQQRWGAVAAVNTFLYTGALTGARSFLTLGGKPGTGKTIAAASALLSCVEELRTDSGRVCKRWTRRGLYMKAAELARLPLFGKEQAAAWERLRERKLLIIDDLGAELPTDGWLSAFGDLVDARMRGEKKTILTTNLSGSELRTRYGDRVIRRLTDYGTFVKCEKPAEAVVP